MLYCKTEPKYPHWEKFYEFETLSAKGEIKFFHPVAHYLNNPSVSAYRGWPLSFKARQYLLGLMLLTMECPWWSSEPCLVAFKGLLGHMKGEEGIKEWEGQHGTSCEVVGGIWLETTTFISQKNPSQVIHLDKGHPKQDVHEVQKVQDILFIHCSLQAGLSPNIMPACLHWWHSPVVPSAPFLIPFPKQIHPKCGYSSLAEVKHHTKFNSHCCVFSKRTKTPHLHNSLRMKGSM